MVQKLVKLVTKHEAEREKGQSKTSLLAVIFFQKWSNNEESTFVVVA